MLYIVPFEKYVVLTLLGSVNKHIGKNMKTKTIFVFLIKVKFTVLFLLFSYESLLGFIHGKVIFEIIKEYDEVLPFPLVTICPKPEGGFAYLKLDQIQQNILMNISNKDIYSPQIYEILLQSDDPISIVNNNSYTLNDVFHQKEDSNIL